MIASDRPSKIQILPYTSIVGQEKLKLALELAFIAPRINGVLIEGAPGTGKSTAVRAFAWMVDGKLPVTLPINATEDRVVGGWKIDALMQGTPERQIGLLEQANGKLLYIDEVNLLDDHIVNIILDVTSTGILVVQRDNINESPKNVSFTMVGTMNPEEGWLRPQLLDRFGLMVNISTEETEDNRKDILQTVLDFDQALFDLERGLSSDYLEKARERDCKLREELIQAREKFYAVELGQAVDLCTELAEEFKAQGNRGDYIMALAARACAARWDSKQIASEHIEAVAELVLNHRRSQVYRGDRLDWTEDDQNKVKNILYGD